MASVHGRAVVARAARLSPSLRYRQRWLSQSRMFGSTPTHLSADDDFVRANLNKSLLDSGQELRPPWQPEPQPEVEEAVDIRSKQEAQSKEVQEKRPRSAKAGSLKERLRAKSRASRDETPPTASHASSPFDGYVLGHPRSQPMRTRFAPSPTGDTHLGSLRTALVNQVVAKATKGGAFVLRIEDTDQSRTVESSQKAIIKDLKWLGLEWTEGPDVGGPHGPYLQSERLHIYKPYVEQLIKEDHAYRCFCTAEDLENHKRRAHEAGQSTQYPGTCRHISHEESSQRASKNEPHVVRFRGDKFGIIGFKDGIKGRFQKAEAEEDFVVWKTDGFPTYHLANVVDDHLMGITHVIRGDEWLVSTPKHLALYQALRWKPPTFAHLPLLFREDGKKLSKRDKAASVEAYKSQVVEPVALANWLAKMSLHKHPTKTLSTIREMSEQSSIKLLSSNTRITSDGVPTQFISLAFTRTIQRYKELLDQDRLETAEVQRVKETLKEYWTPAIEDISKATREGESSSYFTKGQTAYLAAVPWKRNLHLVEALRDLADGPVWTETVFNYIANLNLQMIGRLDQDLSTFVFESPWLFWRPPKSLHRGWVALLFHARRPPTSELCLLRKAYSQGDDVVSSGRSAQAADPLKQVVGQSSLAVAGARESQLALLQTHNRLVLTGGRSVAQPSGIMLRVLGYEESRARLSMVEEVCAELQEGGQEVWKAYKKEADKERLESKGWWQLHNQPNASEGRSKSKEEAKFQEAESREQAKFEEDLKLNDEK